MSDEVIIALIGAGAGVLGGGALGAIITAVFNRDKTRAEIEAIQSQIEASLWSRTQAALAERDKRIDELEAENGTLRGLLETANSEIADLQKQIEKYERGRRL